MNSRWKKGEKLCVLNRKWSMRLVGQRANSGLNRPELRSVHPQVREDDISHPIRLLCQADVQQVVGSKSESRTCVIGILHTLLLAEYCIILHNTEPIQQRRLKSCLFLCQIANPRTAGLAMFITWIMEFDNLTRACCLEPFNIVIIPIIKREAHRIIFQQYQTEHKA